LLIIVLLVIVWKNKENVKQLANNIDTATTENIQLKQTNDELSKKLEKHVKVGETAPESAEAPAENGGPSSDLPSNDLAHELEVVKKQKDEIEGKYKKIWQTSLSVHKQKEEVERLNNALNDQKIELENAHIDISAKNAKLWKTSLLVNKQKEEVERIKEQIAEKNKHITDSIKYAEIIQRALLPPKQDILKAIPQSFIYYAPKDIVSGDFYWFADIGKEKRNTCVIAAVDCTGHGVPGAFMSMIGNELLNSIIMEKKVYEPGKIIDRLQGGIRFALRKGKDKSGSEVRDGMDIALCTVDFDEMEVEFAGANNPVYIVRGSKGKGDNGYYELEEIKGNKAIQFEDQQEFSNHKFKVEKGDSFFIFSDGYADQFGGEAGKKFKYSQFKKLLVSINDEPMDKQGEILEKTMNDWRGTAEQIDDIIVIGVKF